MSADEDFFFLKKPTRTILNRFVFSWHLHCWFAFLWCE